MGGVERTERGICTRARSASRTEKGRENPVETFTDHRGRETGPREDVFLSGTENILSLTDDEMHLRGIYNFRVTARDRKDKNARMRARGVIELFLSRLVE